jgi:hypothetical protein
MNMGKSIQQKSAKTVLRVVKDRFSKLNKKVNVRGRRSKIILSPTLADTTTKSNDDDFNLGKKNANEAEIFLQMFED